MGFTGEEREDYRAVGYSVPCVSALWLCDTRATGMSWKQPQAVIFSVWPGRALG